MLSKQYGASALEFALMLPIFLLSIDGVLEFSLLMYDKSILHNAALQGARIGSVYRVLKSDNSEIDSTVRKYLSNYLISFGTSDSVVVLIEQSPSKSYQTPLKVSISYTYTSLLGGSFFSAIGMPITLTESVTFMNE